MSVEPFETAARAIDDFGIDVIVRPYQGDAYPVRMLFSSITVETGIGHGSGGMATHLFRALPDQVDALQEGDSLEASWGATYAVCRITPRPLKLTRIEVVER